MPKRSRLETFYILLIFVFLYLPILCVVVYSFNVSKTTSVWNGFTLDWYVKMLNDRNLMESLGVSLIVAFMASLVSAVFGTMGAVAFEKLTSKIKLFFNGSMYIPLIIPEVVMGVALLMFLSLIPNINYGILTLVLAHTTFCLPYIFIMVGIKLKTIDKSIFEAAKDLGAKENQMFFTVTLPLILPSIISGALLAFAMSLDDVVISFFVSGPTSTTLPVKIYSMLKFGVTPEINALCTVMLFATFLIVGVFRFIQTKISIKEDTK